MEQRPSFINMAPDAGCACCQLDATMVDGSGQSFGCSERETIFTRREEQVLRRIRDARREAEALKKKISLLNTAGSPPLDAREKAVTQLEELRRLRRELEQERLDAATERMVLLGHA